MNNKEFNIDDILEEVDRKRAEKENNQQEQEIEVIETKEEPKEEKEESNTIELQHETLGTKQEGLNKATKSNKGKISTAIGVIATIGIMIVAGKSCSNENNNNKSSETTTTTAVTTETKEETTTKPQIEIEIEMTDDSFDTTIPVTDIPHDDEEETEEIEDKKEETTTSIVINPDELIVTSTSAPITTPKVEETTLAQTTVKPVQTTTTVITEAPMVITTEAEKEIPVEIVPIKIKNLDEKVDILKATAQLSGYLLSDDLAIDTIRVLHSDYIEHDNFDEITAQKYNDVLTVLTNIGSVNENLLNMSYITGQLQLSGKFYLPAAIFPENIQSYMKEFNNLTDKYVEALNDNQYTPGEVDYEEIQQRSIEEQQKYLDEYQHIMIDDEETVGIENFDEYLKLLEKSVNNQIDDEEEMIRLAELENQTKAQIGRERAYKAYIKDVQTLINKPEYKDMASTKLGFLTNVTPVLLSGVDTNNYENVANKVQYINETITTSVDDIRETLIKANRINNKKTNGQKIDQKEVLEAYVKEATERNEEESKLFSSVIDNIKEQASAYVMTR